MTRERSDRLTVPSNVEGERRKWPPAGRRADSAVVVRRSAGLAALSLALLVVVSSAAQA